MPTLPLDATLDEYQAAAASFINPNLDEEQNLQMCTLGIASESGEIAEEIKHHLYHGHVLNRDNLKKELGDILWYVAGMCTHYGWSLNEMATMNIDKLDRRYPNGFTEKDSRERKEYGIRVEP